MTAPSLRARILERAGLSDAKPTPSQVEQLARYYELLERWNRKINLTALPLTGFPNQTLDVILVEPIAAAGHIGPNVSEWFDLGSGGGSPAIPMKILCPAVQLTMVESRSRKSAFLREAVQSLGLSKVTVWTGRMEELPAATVDLVTVRAVRIDSVTTGVALSLLAVGGKLAAFGTGEAPSVSRAFALDSSTELVTPGRRVHWFVRRC